MSRRALMYAKYAFIPVAIGAYVEPTPVSGKVAPIVTVFEVTPGVAAWRANAPGSVTANAATATARATTSLFMPLSLKGSRASVGDDDKSGLLTRTPLAARGRRHRHARRGAARAGSRRRGPPEPPESCRRSRPRSDPGRAAASRGRRPGRTARTGLRSPFPTARRRLRPRRRSAGESTG